MVYQSAKAENWEPGDYTKFTNTPPAPQQAQQPQHRPEPPKPQLQQPNRKFIHK